MYNAIFGMVSLKLYNEYLNMAIGLFKFKLSIIITPDKEMNILIYRTL